VNWWFEKSDQCGRSSRSRRLYCDEMGRQRGEDDWKSIYVVVLVEITSLQCVPVYLEPVQRSENVVRIGGPGSCNNRAFWMHWLKEDYNASELQWSSLK